MIFSASRLDRFIQCPYSFKLIYIDKVKQLDVPNTELECGSFVHAITEDYCKTGNFKNSKSFIEKYLKTKPYSEKLNKLKDILLFFKENNKGETLELESTMNFVFPFGMQITGRIDRIAQVDNKIKIIDYKTSKSVDTQITAQQKLYYYYGKKKYPNNEVELEWQYLFCGKIKIIRDLDVKEIDISFEKLYNRINHAIKLNLFEYSNSWICKYCSVITHCKRGNIGIKQ